MADPSPPAASAPTAESQSALDDHLARGIRALALRKYSDACDFLAQALESSTSKYGDLAPENVESLVLYGKALLGSAIAQSAVLGGAAPGAGPGGGEGANGDAAMGAAGPSNGAAGASSSSTATASAGPSNPNFHFGGDAEDASGDESGADSDGEGDDGEGDDAPAGDREDDLESAFQMLDIARTILTTEIGAMEGKEEGEERRKREEKLAEVHRLLGDVATESEQFDNAVEEYTSSLTLLSRLLPPYDRTLSELHMLTALALEFVPNATTRAVEHAEKAKSVLVLKLGELESVREGEREEKVKREIEDIKGLMGDVDMKIEDLRTIPTAPAPSSTDSALEALLRQSSSAMAEAAASGAVNDLTGLVKRKKKVVPVKGVVEEHLEGGGKGGEEENVLVVKPVQGEEAEGKRKAEEGAEDVKETKKVKIDGQ